MTSLPNPASSATASSHLSVTPTSLSVRRNNHRHRRSAAISGDFDIMGLGLFSPKQQQQQQQHTHSHSHNITSSNSTKDKKNDDDFEFGAGLSTNAEFEKRFHFNNEDDFTNKPTSGDFAFPLKTPELGNGPTSPNFSFGGGYGINTPPRHFNSSNFRKSYSSSSHNLNSPIKLNHRKAQSTANTPKTKFFLTEETNINSENVPDAVIDLDEILNANLHIGNDDSSSHKRSGLLPKDIFNGQTDHEDDFLASPSPFFKHNFGNSFSSSPLSAPNNNITLFQQPIQEKTTDSIEEEDDDENDKIDDDDDDQIENNDDYEDEYEHKHKSEHLEENQQQSAFTNPQDALGAGMYTNSSANLSCSSLRSNSNNNNSNTGNVNANQPSKFPGSHLIEKTLSNSSKESTNSGNLSNTNFNSTTPTSKRSGAKANRYQSFYDQSYKITNALKFSSSESINLVRSNSSGQNLTINDVSNNNTNNNSNNGSVNALPREILLSNTSKQLGHSSSLPSLKSSLSLKRSVTPTSGVSPSARFNDSRFKQEAKKLSSPPSVSINGIINNQFTPPSSDASPNVISQHHHQLPQRHNTINTPPLSSSQFSPSKRNQYMKQSSTVTPPSQINLTPVSNSHSSIDGRIETPDYTIAQLSSQPVESNPLTNPQHHPLMSHHQSSHLPRSPQQENDHPDQHQPQQSHVLMAKNISNSPVSVTSDVSSTVLSANEASTDHSSLISLNEQPSSSAAPVLKRLKQKQQHSNQSDSNNLSTDNMMPAIVISKDVDVTSTSSTDSTFKQVDDDTVDLPLIVSKATPSETDHEVKVTSTPSTNVVNTSPSSSADHSKSQSQSYPLQTQPQTQIITTEVDSDVTSPNEAMRPLDESSPIKAPRKPPAISIPIHSPQAIPARVSTPIDKTRDINDIGVSTPPLAPFATDNTSLVSSNSSSRSSPRASPKRKRAPRRPLSPSEDKVLKSTQIPSFNAPTSAVTTPELGSRRRLNNDENAHPYSFFASYMRKSLVCSTITQPLPMTPDLPSHQGQVESPRGRHSKSKSFSLVLLDLTPGMTKTNNVNTDDGSSILSKTKNNRLINWFRKKR